MYANYRPQHIALLLAIALLMAQWVGLMHRVEHPIWLKADAAVITTNTAEAAHTQPVEESHHHCAAFDAAATGDTFQLFLAQPTTLVTASLAVVWPPIVSWQAPATRCFSPRGPPRF